MTRIRYQNINAIEKNALTGYFFKPIYGSPQMEKIMHVKVKELLAKAAYNGITRKAISARAGIAPSSFTNWRNKNPRLDTLDKAEKALNDLIALKEIQ